MKLVNIALSQHFISGKLRKISAGCSIIHLKSIAKIGRRDYRELKKSFSEIC
jgi:hypothetical protein